MTLGYLSSFLVVTLLVVGVAVPTPGQVGGFHTAYRIAVVTFFNQSETAAVGAAIVLHAIFNLPVTALGALFMIQEGLSIRKISALASANENGDVTKDEDLQPHSSRPMAGCEDGRCKSSRTHANEPQR
jgi:hypothetical protein